MPTVIDSLIVTLGLDGSKFGAGAAKVNAGLKQVGAGARQADKDIEAFGRSAGEQINRLRNQVLTLFLAFTAGRGIKDFVVGTMTAAAAAGRFANVVGMSTQQLSAWQGAVEQAAGGTAEGAAASIGNLTRSFQELSLTGQSSTVPFFRRLGVQIADANNRLRPMSDILMDVSKAFQGMDPREASFMAAGMGLDSGMTDLLLKGPDAVRAALAKQGQQGVFTDAQARSMQKLQDALIGLEKASAAFGTTLLDLSTPGIVAIAEKLRGFLIDAREGVGPLGDVGVRLKSFIDQVAKLIDATLKGEGPLVRFVEGLQRLIRQVSESWIGRYFGWSQTAAAPESEEYKDPETRQLYRERFSPGGVTGPASAGGGGSAPVPGSPQDQVMEEARTFFRRRGLTEAQTAGILANIGAESGFNPNAMAIEKDGSQSYGLFQHNKSRLDAMRAKYGPNPTAEQQMEFAWGELNTSHRGALTAVRGAYSASDAAERFSRLFEVPADTIATSERRGRTADRFLPRTIAPALIPRAGGASAPAPVTNTTVTIGQITISSAATDARGIARDLAAEVRRNMLVPQAASGLA